MNKDLPIWILEPELAEKQELSAWKLSEKRKQTEPAADAGSIDSIKRQLRELRVRSRENINPLTEELRNSLSRKYPGAQVIDAPDSSRAVEYITGISDGIKVISINNSSVVTQELAPGLKNNSFNVINSYLNEYDVEERKILDYWDLPRIMEKNLSGTFRVSEKLTGIERPGTAKSREYIAVLGVNAISAEEGTAFFLQHFHNILNDLSSARKIVLVVGIDKIVKSNDDADFQTKCMGIFGMENILLGVKPKPEDVQSISDLELPAGDGEKELHVIILDNGRQNLLNSKFSDLFLCIGCRACNIHCPIRHSFTDTDYIWTPKNYLSQFLYGKSSSIDTCLHCEACRMECPVDIDLPHLMWQKKIDYVNSHGRSFSHKMLGAPERLAKLASPFAPVANLLMRSKLVRVPMESITGIDRKTTLPVFHSAPFRKRFQKNG
ncbi:4Fe-4S dicluster domain-containing protein [Chloroflexota bacterium]